MTPLYTYLHAHPYALATLICCISLFQVSGLNAGTAAQQVLEFLLDFNDLQIILNFLEKVEGDWLQAKMGETLIVSFYCLGSFSFVY